jgi:hypothetical protein
MRDQNVKTRSTRAKVQAANTDRQVVDLLNFLNGQEHLPDVSLQHDDLRQVITAVMDDELISSLDAVLEDAMFHPELHPDRRNDYVATHQLLKKLRDLQKARLRDAIELFTKPARS